MLAHLEKACQSQGMHGIMPCGTLRSCTMQAWMLAPTSTPCRCRETLLDESQTAPAGRTVQGRRSPTSGERALVERHGQMQQAQLVRGAPEVVRRLLRAAPPQRVLLQHTPPRSLLRCGMCPP